MVFLQSPFFLFFASLLLLLIFIFLGRFKSINRTSRLPPGLRKLPFIGNIHNLAGALPRLALQALTINYRPLVHPQPDAVLNRVIGSSAEVVIPNHVAIIMDGHGRWAKSRGLTIEQGHEAGIANLRRLIPACRQSGIKFLTLFGFSTENWKRSKEEIDCIMSMAESFILSYAMEEIRRHEMGFHVIGDINRMPESLQRAISTVKEVGKSNKGMQIILAMSYSGRRDITEAAKKIARKVQRGVLQVNDISEGVMEQELMTNFTGFSDPDLVIRTSGEQRISNFMLWQLAYTELYFAQKMFPDFGEEDLANAIKAFQGRQAIWGAKKLRKMNMIFRFRLK